MRVSIGLIIVLAGCATKGESLPDVETPATAQGTPQALAYGTPPTPTMMYEFSDTAVSDIQAGAAGAIRVSTGVRGAAELKFEESGGDDQKVTVAFPQFSGTFSNSA